MKLDVMGHTCNQSQLRMENCELENSLKKKKKKEHDECLLFSPTPPVTEHK
jgi:hypothetical protein